MKNPSHTMSKATRRQLPTILTIACLTLAGCTGMQSAPPSQPASLADTAWQLISFQPTQAGAEAEKPSRNDQFQLQFDEGGRLLARLDCNRGSGRWQAPADGGAAGSLRIGPLVSTKMMCPPDPFAQRVPADIESARRYRIEGDRLILENDAGTTTWERAPRLDGQ